jgi:hypothetical protein
MVARVVGGVGLPLLVKFSVNVAGAVPVSCAKASVSKLPATAETVNDHVKSVSAPLPAA